MHYDGHSLPFTGILTGIGFPGVYGLSCPFMQVYGHSLPFTITGIGFPGVLWTFMSIHASLWSFTAVYYHWNRLSRSFMDFHVHSCKSMVIHCRLLSLE